MEQLIKDNCLNVGDVFSLKDGSGAKFKIVRVRENRCNASFVDIQVLWVPKVEGGGPSHLRDLRKKLATKEVITNCCLYHDSVLINKDLEDVNKEYPHKCPKCGSAAYVGIIETDCSQCGRF